MTRPKDFVTPELCQNFLTSPGERLIVAKRQHWFVLFSPLMITGLLTLLLISLSAFLFLGPAANPTLFVISLSLSLSASASIIAKNLADWYYHIYMVTTKRILEVSCAPLFFHSINDVALDQVRVTEIDVKIRGFVNELLEMGDVIIEFDRPSHEKMFTISSIKDPSTTGALIANSLKLMMEQSPVWFQPRSHTSDLYKFTEDVFDHDHEQTPSVAEA